MGLQLPRWVWIGAVALACVAGMVNVIGYLGFEHQAVSHLTGTTSLLGAALAQGNLRAVMHLWGMLIAFCLGAMLSGLIIQDQTLRLGRRYGAALALEASLLLAAIPLFKQEQIWGALLAATACGLQNAMVTTYSGAAVRTTHLSGMFTDLGIGLGHLLRGMPLQVRRLTLSGLIISGFL
ncbi:MAG TPA: YoaK family protein, partial [Telluria sp.]